MIVGHELNSVNIDVLRDNEEHFCNGKGSQNKLMVVDDGPQKDDNIVYVRSPSKSLIDVF